MWNGQQSYNITYVYATGRVVYSTVWPNSCSGMAANPTTITYSYRGLVLVDFSAPPYSPVACRIRAQPRHMIITVLLPSPLQLSEHSFQSENAFKHLSNQRTSVLLCPHELGHLETFSRSVTDFRYTPYSNYDDAINLRTIHNIQVRSADL